VIVRLLLGVLRLLGPVRVLVVAAAVILYRRRAGPHRGDR
jgi:hypothetical protein